MSDLFLAFYSSIVNLWVVFISIKHHMPEQLYASEGQAV